VELKELWSSIDLVTGARLKNSIQRKEEIDDEEQEMEASRLVEMVDKLNRTGVMKVSLRKE